jgi:hypothetical protein
VSFGDTEDVPTDRVSDLVPDPEARQKVASLRLEAGQVRDHMAAIDSEITRLEGSDATEDSDSDEADVESPATDAQVEALQGVRDGLEEKADALEETADEIEVALSE